MAQVTLFPIPPPNIFTQGALRGCDRQLRLGPAAIRVMTVASALITMSFCPFASFHCPPPQQSPPHTTPPEWRAQRGLACDPFSPMGLPKAASYQPPVVHFRPDLRAAVEAS